MTEQVLIDLMTRGSVVLLLALIVVAFLKEWVYPAAAFQRLEALYESLEREKNEWKRLALDTNETVDRAVSLVEPQ